jgi:deoxyribodipyrimidine photo-lyase
VASLAAPLGHLPILRDLVAGVTSPDPVAGGESRGRARLDAWLRRGLGRYPDRHDDLAADGTSRLSAYLHFGCLSPVEVARRAAVGRAVRPSSASSAGATSTIR